MFLFAAGAIGLDQITILGVDQITILGDAFFADKSYGQELFGSVSARVDLSWSVEGKGAAKRRKRSS
jgi:hypothetical protein